MSNDKMREEFEKWAVDEGLTLHGKDGRYLMEIQSAWMAWQASRAAHAVQEEPVAYMFVDDWGRTKIVLGKETAEYWAPPGETIEPLYTAPQPDASQLAGDVEYGTALFCDLKTDEEKSTFFLLGRGYETGVIAQAIQNDVAMAYHRCSEYRKELEALRDECEKLQAEYEQLISYTKNGIECFANPCAEHSGLNVPPFSEFQERYGRLCLMCVVDDRDALRAECEGLRTALAESRANDRQAMAYLGAVREIVGGDSYPEMIERVKELQIERNGYKLSLKEWLEKSEWVQETAFVKELGKHRADVMRERIQELQEERDQLLAAIRRLCNIYVVDGYYEGEMREKLLDDAVNRAIERGKENRE